MKYQVKYFDIEVRAKKTNGWERSLLELKRMMQHGERKLGNRVNTIHPAQHKKVARAAKRQKKSIAHIIRELVDKHVK